nr:MAG TPA: hypothetical protein [Caudoviricetes sp.]
MARQLENGLNSKSKRIACSPFPFVFYFSIICVSIMQIIEKMKKPPILPGVIILITLVFNLLGKLLDWTAARYSEHKKQQSDEPQRQAEIAAWQADLHEEAQNRQRQRAEHQALLAKECETLDGFLAHRQAVYKRVLRNVRHYAYLGRLTPRQRTEQIIWDSLQIIFESKNAKTMESRMGVIRDCAERLISPPIDEHTFRLVATHYYVSQIVALKEKMANYKTQAAKNRAAVKIEQLFQQAANDAAVYRKAVSEYQAMEDRQNQEA